MTRLLNKFIIDGRFYRLMTWTIDRAKHFSEMMYLCYLLTSRKDIFCCSQNSHGHILAGLHIHVQI